MGSGLSSARWDSLPGDGLASAIPSAAPLVLTLPKLTLTTTLHSRLPPKAPQAAPRVIHPGPAPALPGRGPPRQPQGRHLVPARRRPPLVRQGPPQVRPPGRAEAEPSHRRGQDRERAVPDKPDEREVVLRRVGQDGQRGRGEILPCTMTPLERRDRNAGG